MACLINPTQRKPRVAHFQEMEDQTEYHQIDTVTIATRTKCLKDPPSSTLIKRLAQYVSVSKNKLDKLEKSKSDKVEIDALIAQILSLFEGIFLYMSSRTSDIDKSSVMALTKMAFIPCKYRGQLVFYLPSQVRYACSRVV